MAWTPMSSGLTVSGVQALAITPTGPPTLYGATDGGVYAIEP